MNSSYCRNCGNKLHAEDRFCMNCGTPVTENPEVSSQEPSPPSSTVATTAPSPTGPRRRLIVAALISAILVVAILVVGFLLLIFSSLPSEASIEPVPGMTMEVPEGWVAPSNQTVTEKNSTVELVPAEYGDIDVEVDGANIPVKIWIGEGSEYECNIEDDVINDDFADADELVQYDPSQSLNAFLSMVVITKGGGNGQIVVDDEESQWGIGKQYYAQSWASEDGLYSEYPNYSVTSITTVCMPENRTVSLLTNASLVPSDPIDAAASGISGPDSTRSAYDSDSIDETNQEVENLYKENFPAFLQLVESIDTGGLFSGETDVDTIPSELSRSHAPVSDPFGEELVAPDTYEDTYDFENDLQYPEETTSPDYENDEPDYFDSEPEDTTYDEVTPDEVTPDEMTSYESEPQVMIYADTPEEEFVSDYFVYVNERDWSSTYDLLDSDSRDLFTEVGWAMGQDAREGENPTPQLTGVRVENVTPESDGGFTADVVLEARYEEIDIPGFRVILEDGEYRRYLNDEDKAYLVELIDYENPYG